MAVAQVWRFRIRTPGVSPPRAQGSFTRTRKTLMISRIAAFRQDGTGALAAPDMAMHRQGFLSLLLLSAWCGLVAGLLEVGAILLRKQVLDPDHLYRMSRHFVWMIPLLNLAIFLALGLVGCGLILVWPGRGRWLFVRGLAAIAVLPPVLVAFPRIYSLAWLIAALGLAVQLVPYIERGSRRFPRFVLVSFKAAIAVVAILGASLWVGDRIKQSRENARPLPPPGSPNVLLIVLDTVAAGHLSLHGYNRSTSTTLVELAERGIRFDFARAPSSWTLPSHASMFTGRWFHELSVGWLTPLDQKHPTLAEFLRDRGYATAGFIANTWYLAADSGVSRGFTVYHDYSFPEFTAFKMTVLVSRALEGFKTIVDEDWLHSVGLLTYVQRLWRSLEIDRKGAAVVTREFFDWLAHRPEPERPFFAFLNYADAHDPYQLLPGRLHRFGFEPTNYYQRDLIQHWFDIDKTILPPRDLAFATAAYDDCVADLDEQLGRLVDLLDRRGFLEHTWLIIASDHGESFGEHAQVFCHGGSLYDTELHVPLVIIPPPGGGTQQAVKEAVSLRDLAATIVDVAGFEASAPFPGLSLARFWKQPGPVAPIQPRLALPSLAEVVPIDAHKRDYWGLPRQLSPLGAVKDGDWSYIRLEGGDRLENLFHVREDPNEQRNLVRDPAARTALEQMRAALDRMTGGPLLPGRFNN